VRRLTDRGGSSLWHTVAVDFDTVYERFRGPVWRLARRLTGDDEEALDTTQEIFVRVWRGLPKFRGEAKLSTWVFQIAWNHLRAHRRRTGRHDRFLLDDTAGRQVAIEAARDPRADPERAAAAGELAARVAAALRELPEHYRVVVWLRDGEDLSYDEIAAVLDIPIGTVRSRLARARAILKQAVV
jgi:RNA polymerase sigma-70 factor (ECF subfamily)